LSTNRSYKTELDPTTGQIALLCKHVGVARFVYNWALERRIKEYKETGKTSSEYEQHKQLNALKKTEFPWMYETSKSAAQHALKNLDAAYKNFFRNLKQGKNPGFPKFKSKKTSGESFFLEYPIRVFENKIQLPRIGKVRLKEKNYIPTSGVKIISATVSKRAGRWFVSVQMEQEMPELKATGEVLGIDLGVKTLAVLSDGRTFQNHKALQKYSKKLSRLQREVSRKVKGSNNREKAKQKVAKLHYKISNIRNDSIHKMTSEILAITKPEQERPSKIVIEDLNVTGMMKNRKLAKALSNVSFSEVRRQLDYKCKWYGVELVIVDRFFPSSKTCSCCGVVNEGLSLNDREWTCVCGAVHDRDLNAAINLKNTVNSAGIYACGDSVSLGSTSKNRRNKNQEPSKIGS
jgi:putative transposase